MTKKTDARPKTSLHKTFFRSFVQWLVTGVVLVWLLASLILLAARWIDPPSTAVQLQRGLQAPDPPHPVSPALQIRSAQPNLARSPACCYRRGGRALLPAPWVRLAPDPNRRRRRFGRRSHSRSFHHYAATCKEPIFRNGPVRPPQGCGVHTGAGGRIRSRQAANSGNLSQRG